MKICVVGAGAIGGLLAVKLANAGEDVTVIDQGPHLDAIRQGGLRLIMADGSEHHAVLDARGDMDGVGEQDLVILAVKAQVLPVVAPGVRGMLGSRTMVVPVQNGLPWWYFEKHGGPFAGHRLQSLDPDGVLADNIPVDNIVGTVTFPAGEIASPGVVRHTEGNRFPIGELDGSRTERAQQLVDLLTRAGFKSFVIEDIRAEMWLKLWGNLSFNPISALTRATLVDICQYPLTRQLARALMEEAQEVAGKLGDHLPGGDRAAHCGRGARGRAQDLDAPGCRGGPLARDRRHHRRGFRTRPTGGGADPERGRHPGARGAAGQGCAGGDGLEYGLSP